MPKTTTRFRSVGKQRLADVSRRFPKNILVRLSSYCKGWTDPKTGQVFSAFGSFAHYDTRATFHRITSFAYVGKRLCAITEELQTTYNKGDTGTMGEVEVVPATVAVADASCVPIDDAASTDDDVRVIPFLGEAIVVHQ